MPPTYKRTTGGGVHAPRKSSGSPEVVPLGLSSEESCLPMPDTSLHTWCRSCHRRELGESEAGVDRLGFEGEDSEDRFVDAPQRLASYESVDGLEAEGVFA